MLYPLSYEGGTGDTTNRRADGLARRLSLFGDELELFERAVEGVQRGPSGCFDAAATSGDAEDLPVGDRDGARDDRRLLRFVTVDLLRPPHFRGERVGQRRQPRDRRFDCADGAGTGIRPADDPAPAKREVHLELVGVGEGEDGEQADPRVAGPPAVTGVRPSSTTVSTVLGVGSTGASGTSAGAAGLITGTAAVGGLALFQRTISSVTGLSACR